MGTLASAIAQLENTNPSYNNPGAITDIYPGATGQTFGANIPIYDSPQSGESAFEQKIANIYNGKSAVYNPSMTLTQFGNTYAPNQNYGASLANILGVSPNTTLSQIPSGVGSVTPTSTPTTGNTANNWFTKSLNTAMDYLDSLTGAPNLDNPAGGQKPAVGIGLNDVLFMLIGILLIAGGIFGFKQSATVVTEFAKGVRDGAAGA